MNKSTYQNVTANLNGRALLAILIAGLPLGTMALAQSSSSKFKLTYDPFKNLGTEQISPADPTNPSQVRAGAALYLENCAECHGAALEGAENWQDATDDGTFLPPAHDDTGHTWHHSDKVLFEYVKLGGEELFKDFPDIVSNMPAFGDVLSDEEIWAIYAYIKSSWSQESINWQTGASRLDPLPEKYMPGANDASEAKD